MLYELELGGDINTTEHLDVGDIQSKALKLCRDDAYLALYGPSNLDFDKAKVDFAKALSEATGCAVGIGTVARLSQGREKGAILTSYVGVDSATLDACKYRDHVRVYIPTKTEGVLLVLYCVVGHNRDMAAVHASRHIALEDLHQNKFEQEDMGKDEILDMVSHAGSVLENQETLVESVHYYDASGETSHIVCATERVDGFCMFASYYNIIDLKRGAVWSIRVEHAVDLPED